MEDVALVLLMAALFGMFVVVPITAILLAHQRKMTEMISQRRNEEGLIHRVKQLEDAVDHLRDRLNDVTLALDDAMRLRLQGDSQDKP